MLSMDLNASGYNPAAVRARISAGVVGSLLLSACGTMPDGHRWGEDVTVRPGWSRVGEAAWDAAKEPSFWVPLVGAGVMQIDGWDRRVSNWARRDTPVFGSAANAGNWSNTLRSASVVSAWTTVLVAPSGTLDSDWLVDKLKGGAVDALAGETAIEFTAGLKRLTQRERPDGSDDQSMPSDHTTASAVYTRLAARNLALTDLQPDVQVAMDAGLDLLTVATAWARIEAGAHYPSDTLVGASIGEFFGNFFSSAFLQPERAASNQAQLTPVRGGAELRWQFRF